MVCYIAIESSPLYNINYFGENKGTSPTSFSHIHALQLAQQGTVTERKLGNLYKIYILMSQTEVFYK